MLNKKTKQTVNDQIKLLIIQHPLQQLVIQYHSVIFSQKKKKRKKKTITQFETASGLPNLWLAPD